MIRVASVPESHVYVRHLDHPDVPQVVRLPDPVPRDGRTVPGGWWPPLMLEPSWIDDHCDLFDVFHVHFGFDALTGDQIRDVVGRLRRHGKPLVYTVHDLRNPHQRDATTHSALLDVLIPAADALITLTPGARSQIKERWDRDATVLPHPHVVPREWFEKRRSSHGWVIAIHAKSLRANMDPLPVVTALAEQVTMWPEAVVRVDVHDEIFDPDDYWYDPAAGRQIMDLANRPQVEVRVHAYYSDDELWDYLDSIAVSVLPYRFGTHSGWMEACHDLGTGIVVPDCGFYGEQRPSEVYGFDEHTGLDAASLIKSVEALRGRPPVRPSWESRWRERAALARAHAQIYASVLR